MKTAPLVSVIVPCWNGSSYLALALDSVRAQSMADWESIILDADDAILPDKLALQLAALRGLPAPALAYCDYANALTLDIERLALPGPFYLPPRFDHERLPSHEDWDCWMRVLDLKPTLRYVNQTLAVYRRRPDSVSSNRRLMRRGFLRAVELQLRRHRHDPDLAAVLAAKRAEVLARYSDMAPAAQLRRAILGGIGVVRAVVPAPVRRRPGPVLRSWLEG